MDTSFNSFFFQEKFNRYIVQSKHERKKIFCNWFYFLFLKLFNSFYYVYKKYQCVLIKYNNDKKIL